MTVLVAADTADSPKDAAHRPARWWMVVLPVAALTAGITAVGAAGRQLWYDEYATWYASTDLTWAQFTRLMENIDAVHALYYVLMRLWTTVAGDSPLALRAPSIAGMAVAAAAITLLGRRLFDTTVGVTAGLLFAALPSVSRYGQEARSYALVTAVAALTTLTLLWTLQRPTWRRFLGYGVCLAVLVYLHGVAALLLVPHAVWVVTSVRRGQAESRPGQAGTGPGQGEPRRRRALWGWLVTVAAVAATVVPLGYRASGQSAQVAWVDRDAEAVARYPEALFGSTTTAWVTVSVAALGVVVAWYARRGPIFPLVLWALLPPLFCYAVYPWVRLFVPKYALFTLPAWVLLAAIAVAVPVTGLRRWLPPADRAVVLGLAVLLLAAAGIRGHRVVRLDPVYGEADFRAAADLIDRGYQPGDGIAYGGFSPGRAIRIVMRYELRAEPRDVFLATPGAELGTFGSTDCTDLAGCLGDTRRIWLVLGAARQDPLEVLPQERAELLRERFTVDGYWRLKRVNVALLSAR